MKKYLFLLGLLFPIWLYAQTAQWKLHPHYTSITPYAEGLLKVKLHSKMGIVDMEGNEIVPATADSITNLSEGYGLILNVATNGKYRLSGIIDKTGKVITITTEMYVGEYPFFSEGKLPVCNRVGKYGFIDTNGSWVQKYKYWSIHPFCEGWAVVSKLYSTTGKTKKFYVNDKGVFLSLQSDIGDVYLATSFNNGEALVMSKDNRYFTINTSGNIIRIENNVTMHFDEKYRLQETDAPIEKSNEIWTPTYNGPEIYEENSLFGYKLNGRVVLPAQFTDAKGFVDGYAIAAKDGYYGLLSLQDGAFECKKLKGTSAISSADEEAVDYLVTIPVCWQQEKLYLKSVRTTDNSRKTFVEAGNNDATRTFSVVLPKGERKISIESSDLVLWNGETKNVTQQPIVEDGPAVSLDIRIPNSAKNGKAVKADATDKCKLNIYVKNNTSDWLEVKIKTTGSNLTGPKMKLLEIEPNDRKIQAVYFNNVGKFDTRKLTVTIYDLEGNVVTEITRTFELEPFYVDD